MSSSNSNIASQYDPTLVITSFCWVKFEYKYKRIILKKKFHFEFLSKSKKKIPIEDFESKIFPIIFISNIRIKLSYFHNPTLKLEQWLKKLVMDFNQNSHHTRRGVFNNYFALKNFFQGCKFSLKITTPIQWQSFFCHQKSFFFNLKETRYNLYLSLLLLHWSWK